MRTGQSDQFGPWIRVFEARPSATFRVFCFSFTGGSAQNFRSWHNFLPEYIEVCPIQLPGRWERIRDTPITRLDVLTAELYGAITPILREKPFAFLGVSMGTLVAFEMARKLRRERGPLPQRLFLASGWAPHLSSPVPRMHTLEDSELLKAMDTHFSGIPKAVFAQPELAAIVVPILRADMQIWETYEHRVEAPLDIPFNISGGTADKTVTRDMLGAWQAHCAAEFQMEFFSGNHFFMQADEPGFLRAVARCIPGR